MTDAVAAMGQVALGTRIKRLGDILQGQAARALDAEGLGLAPGHMVIFLTLKRHAPLSVTDLAQHIGISQPAVTRMVLALKGRGYIGEHPSPDDARRTLLSLTGEGARLVDHLEAGFLSCVAISVRAILEEAGLEDGGQRFLDDLSRIEAALAQRSLDQRVGDLRGQAEEEAS